MYRQCHTVAGEVESLQCCEKNNFGDPQGRMKSDSKTIWIEICLRVSNVPSPPHHGKSRPEIRPISRHPVPY